MREERWVARSGGGGGGGGGTFQERLDPQVQPWQDRGGRRALHGAHMSSVEKKMSFDPHAAINHEWVSEGHYPVREEGGGGGGGGGGTVQ